VFAGVALGRAGQGWLETGARPVQSRVGRALAWAGRHSLAIYLLHQPVLFGTSTASSKVAGPNLTAVAERVERDCPGSYLAAGVAEPVARATCACTVEGMKAGGCGRISCAIGWGRMGATSSLASRAPAWTGPAPPAEPQSPSSGMQRVVPHALQ
jgi:hypothetical protein